MRDDPSWPLAGLRQRDLNQPFLATVQFPQGSRRPVRDRGAGPGPQKRGEEILLPGWRYGWIPIDPSVWSEEIAACNLSIEPVIRQTQGTCLVALKDTTLACFQLC